MTDEEKRIKELEEKKKRNTNNDKYKDKVISEDGTLSAFGFADNYK
jgi:hypothetical protein